MNAFVLAGGQSTRMGRDKALLDLGGSPLIEHALEKLRALGFSPHIAGSRPDLARFAPVVADNHSQQGPLGGIEAALAASDAEQNFFLAVDLPWLPIAFLRWMIDRAGVTNALATVPRLQGLPQPLCAIYRRAMLPHAQATLAEGDAKVMRAVERAASATGLRIDSFDVESVAAAQGWPQTRPLHRWFDNLNTPADLNQAALEQLPPIH
ncbi:MAG: molybdenum cofactor guanylyltransferase [Acidobacteriaceae bacterium]